ncbi:MAG: hypothetical protein LBR07_10415 [Puniceicoccales bacterium]|jgi:lipopolysaccharide biosynthesis glycosyltransferase|nr:hypothetical protein [Puniceicoccales bacterium]
MPQNIPIFLAFNDNYCAHARAVMKSVLENTATPVTFHILHSGLNETSKERIRSLTAPAWTKPTPCSICFHQVDKDAFHGFKLEIKHITLEACFRLMIPALMPELDKAIYLDCDIIVRQDIAELWDMDISDVFAGVVEDVIKPPNYEKLFAPNRYFNAGILLLNCKRIREHFSFSDFLEIEREHRADFSWQDQDVLNYAFAGNVRFLPPKWNVSFCFFEPERKFTPRLGYTTEEIRIAREDPAIVHFVNSKKPWLVPCGLAASPYAHEYFKYADKDDESPKSSCRNALIATLRHPDRIFKPQYWIMARLRHTLDKRPILSLRTTRKLAQFCSCFLWSKERRDGFRDFAVCNWLKRNLLARYKRNFHPLYCRESVPVPKVIWQLWWQGLDNAPPIVNEAIRSVAKLASENGYKHIILTKENYLDYVSIPQNILDGFKAGKIKIQSFSDAIRLELLRKHGGIWIDATCFVSKPFPKWTEDCDFFVYQTTGKFTPRNLVQSCFIISKPHSEIIAAWAWAVRDFWRIEQRTSEYFYIHKIIKVLVENDERLQKEFAKMPLLNHDCAHKLFPILNEPFDSEKFAEAMNTPDAMFQKTYYKRYGAPFPPKSFGDKLGRKFTEHLTLNTNE